MLEPKSNAHIYQKIVDKCWANADFKAKLLASPQSVLNTVGFNLPEGTTTVRVIEGAKDEFLFYIPYNNLGLTDDQLADAIAVKTMTDYNKLASNSNTKHLLRFMPFFSSKT